MQGLFFGLKAAVLVIVIEAVLRVGRRALKNNIMRGLAAVAFIALFFYDVPFPVIILAAGLIGYVGGRAGMPAFLAGGGHGKVGDRQVADADSLLGEETPAHARPERPLVAVDRRGVPGALAGAGGGALWFGLGGDNVFTQIAIFFSQMAVVTFGGAYAVLAYVAQQAVDNYHWVTAGEMLDGLGMAETTPGPLIMVTQFVGFLGAWREPRRACRRCSPRRWAGCSTTWVTFVPCFLWIFFGAPFVEALRANKALGAALGAITAAVVGVILNLAVWFALHVLFAEAGAGAMAGGVARRAGAERRSTCPRWCCRWPRRWRSSASSSACSPCCSPARWQASSTLWLLACRSFGERRRKHNKNMHHPHAAPSPPGRLDRPPPPPKIPIRTPYPPSRSREPDQPIRTTRPGKGNPPPTPPNAKTSHQLYIQP